MARVSDNWGVERLHNYSTILGYIIISRLTGQYRKLPLTSFTDVEKDEEDYQVTSEPIKLISYKYLIAIFQWKEKFK